MIRYRGVFMLAMVIAEYGQQYIYIITIQRLLTVMSSLCRRCCRTYPNAFRPYQIDDVHSAKQSHCTLTMWFHRRKLRPSWQTG